MAGGEGELTSLGYTPTWAVASTLILIGVISLSAENFFSYALEKLKTAGRKHALLQIKEEFMLLGFISLLLTLSQSRISKICVKQSLMHHLLPCSLSNKKEALLHLHTKEVTAVGYCASKNMVAFLSFEDLHRLHIFIFIIGVVHAIFSCATIALGELKIRGWANWEESSSRTFDNFSNLERGVRANVFIAFYNFGGNLDTSTGNCSNIKGWLNSFFKIFYKPVTEQVYVALSWGFKDMHCQGNPAFDFYIYIVGAFNDDCKKVVRFRWYLWVSAALFTLMNINGWHTYLWISIFFWVLLFAVGTKLQHIIYQLAQKFEENINNEPRDLGVHSSDHLFWFHRPNFMLFCIHVMIFQNAFDVAYGLWMEFQFGSHLCTVGKIGNGTLRMFLGLFIRSLCGYSILPLYVLVSQTEKNYKKSIFDEQTQAEVVGSAQHGREIPNRVSMAPVVLPQLQLLPGPVTTSTDATAAAFVNRVMRRSKSESELI